jgi:hypothetical protein
MQKKAPHPTPWRVESQKGNAHPGCHDQDHFVALHNVLQEIVKNIVKDYVAAFAA